MPDAGRLGSTGPARWPALVHLVGHPGSGKRTVAVALVEQAAARGRPMVLLDNHRTANLILELAGADGRRALPAVVWDRVGEVREAVYRTVEELSPREWSFVFTNVLVADQPDDVALVGRLRALAAARASRYVPVEVRCELDELIRRVPGRDRVDHMKWIDPDGVRDFVAQRRLFVPEGALVLDTTTQPPVVTARRLLDHLDAR